MLMTRRCPFTGVVNFYAKSEPFLAVASVVPQGDPAHFVWHYFGDGAQGQGRAQQLTTAASAIKAQHRQALRHEDCARAA